MPSSILEAVHRLQRHGVQLNLYQYDVCINCDMPYRCEQRAIDQCPLCDEPRLGPNHRPQMIMLQHSVEQWLRALMMNPACAKHAHLCCI